MEKKENRYENNDFFSARRLEDSVLLYFKENLLFKASDSSFNDKILSYLNRVSGNDSIKVVHDEFVNPIPIAAFG